MKQKTKRRFLVVGSAIAGLALACVLWAWPMLAPFGGADAAVVRIPDGATAEAVADSLRANLGEGYAGGVLRAWHLLKGTPQSANGLYVVDPGTPAYKLARRLQTGRQTPVRLTFNNIRTLDELAARVGSKMEFGADDFLKACDTVLPPLGFPGRAEYPAAFLPDTYEFYWTTGSNELVERLVKVRNSYWNDERRKKAAALGLNPVGVATVASIVEEETLAADERPMVARLYLNRLAKGMKLQADPTVKFAVGDFSLRRITGAHLRTPSPYNTYLNAGLPPGPIRIPERSSLDAVLNAPSHNYIYMCAKADFSGRHSFATDYATHERNAAAYRKALDARGIK